MARAGGGVEVAAALILGLAGVLLLALGWVGASGQAAVGDQVRCVGLAVAGLVVAAAGAGLHLSALARQLGARSLRFEAAVAAWVEEQRS